jgi:membrane protease YdiL (CAAX protease family)
MDNATTPLDDKPLSYNVPHPSAPFAFLWVLFFLIATQVPGALVVIALIMIKGWMDGDFASLLGMAQEQEFQESAEYSFMLAPALALSQILTVVVGITVLRFTAGIDWPRRIALRLPPWHHVLLTLTLFPALVFLGEGIDKLVRPILPEIIHMENAIVSFSNWPWWLGVLIIGVGPALGEELWCRGFLGRGLIANHGVIKGVLLSSLLFGIMHVEPRQVAYATVLGVILHCVYLWTRSLFMPMLLHFMNNSLSMIQISRDGPSFELLNQIEAAGVTSPFWLYGGTLSLLACSCMALHLSRPKLSIIDPEGKPIWAPPFKGVAYPPNDSNTKVEYPFPKISSWLLVLLGLSMFVLGTFMALKGS